MGTRSGDVDPGLLGYVAERLELDAGRRGRRPQHPQRPARPVRAQQRHAHCVRRRRAGLGRGPAGRRRVLLPGGQVGRRARGRARRPRRAGLHRRHRRALPSRCAARSCRPPRRARPGRGPGRQRRPRRRHRRAGEPADGDRVAIVVPTDEELLIARDTLLLAGQSAVQPAGRPDDPHAARRADRPRRRPHRDLPGAGARPGAAGGLGGLLQAAGPAARPRRRPGPLHRAGAAHLAPAAAGADRGHPRRAGALAQRRWTRCSRTWWRPPSRWWPRTTSWSSRAWSPARAWSTPVAPTWRWPRRWTPTCCSWGRRTAPTTSSTWPRRWRSPPAPTRAASATRVVGAVVNRVPDLTPERLDEIRALLAAAPPGARRGGALPARAGLAAGVRRGPRPRRPGAQRGRAGPAGQGRHRRRPGGARHPAAAARGPAAHRAGGPRRDHPQSPASPR